MEVGRTDRGYKKKNELTEGPIDGWALMDYAGLWAGWARTQGPASEEAPYSRCPKGFLDF